MKVLLRLVDDGREIPVTVPIFLIGREAGCHLRPKSDMVSRKHCAILQREGEVRVRDLGSRNGVLVNGVKVEGEKKLVSGDRVTVAPHEFEIEIDYAATVKRPKVKDVKDAVQRLSQTGLVDSDITDWLSEADEEERERRLVDPETRQFRVEETQTVEAPQPVAETDKTQPPTGQTTQIAAAKKEPGKLPKQPAADSKDSREAAADMLKKFFSRR